MPRIVEYDRRLWRVVGTIGRALEIVPLSGGLAVRVDESQVRDKPPVVIREGKVTRDSVERIPIYEDAERSWDPERMATDEQMNTVLEILMERGEALQSEIVEELGVRLEMQKGYAGAAVSASLLYFRQAGWVEFVREERTGARGGPTRLWRLIP